MIAKTTQPQFPDSHSTLMQWSRAICHKFKLAGIEYSPNEIADALLIQTDGYVWAAATNAVEYARDKRSLDELRHEIDLMLEAQAGEQERIEATRGYTKVELIVFLGLCVTILLVGWFMDQAWDF